VTPGKYWSLMTQMLRSPGYSFLHLVNLNLQESLNGLSAPDLESK
jgi:hypothetical protein